MKITRCPACKRRLVRTGEQNRLYWALLHRMAEQMRPRGQTFGAETFHLWAKSRFLGCIDHVLPSGKTMTLPLSTAVLDADQFASYFDKVQAFANEHGVYLEDSEAA